MAEMDNSGNILKTYLHNPDDNEPISMTEGTDTYWYLNDHLMTPQKLIDSSQNIVWSADYKAFGEVAVEPSSTITNNLRFPGQYQDLETNLYYNYHRYYDSDTGRYLQNDLINLATLELPENIKPNLYLWLPKLKIIFKDDYNYIIYLLILNSPNPNVHNPYIYTLNNPTRFIDPTGEVAPIVIVAGIMAVVYTIASILPYFVPDSPHLPPELPEHLPYHPFSPRGPAPITGPCR